MNRVVSWLSSHSFELCSRCLWQVIYFSLNTLFIWLQSSPISGCIRSRLTVEVLVWTYVRLTVSGLTSASNICCFPIKNSERVCSEKERIGWWWWLSFLTFLFFFLLVRALHDERKWRLTRKFRATWRIAMLTSGGIQPFISVILGLPEVKMIKRC